MDYVSGLFMCRTTKKKGLLLRICILGVNATLYAHLCFCGILESKASNDGFGILAEVAEAFTFSCPYND